MSEHITSPGEKQALPGWVAGERLPHRQLRLQKQRYPSANVVPLREQSANRVDFLRIFCEEVSCHVEDEP